MQIFVPDTLKDIQPQLKTFIDAMIHKLDLNAHKGKWEGMDLTVAMKRLEDEVQELRDAINEGNTVHIMLETADVANFALMACDIAIKRMSERPFDRLPPGTKEAVPGTYRPKETRITGETK